MADSNALLASLLMGQKRRSDPLEQQQKYGANLMQQGSATTPVLSPWEGVARALQGGLGGLMSGYAYQQQEEQDKGNITALSDAATKTTPQDIANALKGIKGNSEMMVPVLGQIIQGRLDTSMKNEAATRDVTSRLGSVFGPQTPGAAPQGGMSLNANAISGIESADQPNNGYGAVGPVANAQGNRAYGKYQVLDSNIAPWTQEVLGKPMSPQEFLANPEAQNKVFEAKFGQYVTQYGSPQAASRAWFAGPGGMNNPNARDVNRTTVAGYEDKFNQGLGGAPQAMPNPAPQAAQPQQPQIAPAPAAAEYARQAQALLATNPTAASELMKKAQEAQAAYVTTMELRQFEASRDADRDAEKRRLDAIENDRREGNKPATAEQALSGGFSDRMQNSNALVEKFEQAGTSFAGRIRENLPMGLGNASQSAKYQQYKQARDDFINAQLRRESGAAIAPSEYANADKQYFPQPGDKPEVIEQKALNRRLAVEGMVRNAGQSYKPSLSVGSSQERPGNAMLEEARSAISRGAPRDKVIERLKSQGVDPAGL